MTRKNINRSTDDRNALHLKAREALWFLESHPALGGSIFGLFPLLQLQIEKTDKRGRIEPWKGLETVYWTRENYKRFKKEFEEEFKDCGPAELKCKTLISIQVPYEEIHGEKWSFDHIEYWGELCIVSFMGKNFNLEVDHKHWQNLSGIETGGRSFEELIVNIAKEFKRIYGNFSGEDFLTEKERKNHKNNKIFLFKESTPTAKIMTRNPEYIRIGPAELNRRWWRWFSKTPYCKKRWGNTARKILAGEDNPFQ